MRGITYDTAVMLQLQSGNCHRRKAFIFLVTKLRELLGTLTYNHRQSIGSNREQIQRIQHGTG